MFFFSFIFHVLHIVVDVQNIMMFVKCGRLMGTYFMFGITAFDVFLLCVYPLKVIENFINRNVWQPYFCLDNQYLAFFYRFSFADKSVKLCKEMHCMFVVLHTRLHSLHRLFGGQAMAGTTPTQKPPQKLQASQFQKKENASYSVGSWWFVCICCQKKKTS